MQEYDWINYLKKISDFTGRTPFGHKLSNEYLQYMRDVQCECVLNRKTYPKTKETENFYFQQFIKEKIPTLKIPDDVWRQAELELKKSYMEAHKFWEPKKTNINKKLLWLASKLTYLHNGRVCKDAGEMTFEEIFNSWDSAASPGYYFNMKYQRTDEFIEKENAYQVISEYWEKLLKTPEPDLYSNALKAELRKVGKNPRTFMGSARRMLAAKQKLFLGQNKRITKNHWDLWIRVGLSNFHGGWNALYEQFKNHVGTKALFWDSDVSGWDRSVPKELLDEVLKIRLQWLPLSMATDENKKRAQVLYNAATEGFVLMELGEVLQKKRGVASGDALTIFDNSIAHEIVAIYALLSMIPENILDNMTIPEIYHLIFDSNIMAFMGDDNLGGVNLDKFPWFDLQKLKQAYADFGFEMKQLNSSKKLEDLQFLSRGFKKVNNVWCAVPDYIKTLCQVVYGGTSNYPNDVLERTIALEREAWPNNELWQILHQFNAWMFDTMQLQLKIKTEKHVSYDILKTEWLSERELRELHCGF